MLSLFYKRWCWQRQELESAWRLISELNTAWLSCVRGGGGKCFCCSAAGLSGGRCVYVRRDTSMFRSWLRSLLRYSLAANVTFNIVWRLCGFYLIALLNVLCSSWTDIHFSVDVKRVWRSSMASMWPGGVSIRLLVNVQEESTRRF